MGNITLGNFHFFTSRNKAIEEEPAASNNSGSEATAGSNIPNNGKINRIYSLAIMMWVIYNK